MNALRPGHHGKHEAVEDWLLWFRDRELYKIFGDILPGTGKHRQDDVSTA